MKKNIKGRILSVMSAAAMAATTMSALPATISASASTLSGQNAKGIVSQMKIGWNLGNTLDAHNSKVPAGSSPETYATQWKMPAPNAQQFQAVKEAGFNTVRIPVTWYEHLEQRGNSYHVNDAWMSYVKKTVDYAIDRDMFVILNIHHEDFINVGQFTDNSYYQAEVKMKSIWSEVAETFKNYDQHLIFEGMNEPRETGRGSAIEWGSGDSNSWNYINRLNEVFVRTVRAQGSSQNQERLLMLPGYAASSSYDAINNIQIPYNAGNVALSVHAYAPYYFTMAHDDKANHKFPGQSGWGEDYESALSDMFGYFGQLQSIKGAPIIIGEFSASDFNNTEDRVRWAKSYLSKAKDKGIPCVLWDNNVIGATDGEAHGYLNRGNCTWYSQSKPVVEAMMEVYNISGSTGEDVNANYVWSKVNVGSDWIELFKEGQGRKVDVWKNFTVSGWKNFCNKDYDFVLVYDSGSEPELVLQDGNYDTWNRISSSDTTSTPFIKKFTYDDIMKAVNSSGLSFNDMKNLFISATTTELTAYGLYAVPKSNGGSGGGNDNPVINDPSLYPVVQTQVRDHKIGFKWNAVQGAEKYGIGVYQANKWVVKKQVDASVHTWTSPQVTSGTYRLVVLAKVNGQWVNTDVFKKSFYVTVR